MPFEIAIVGRPNVGKSTLFNRLVGRRLALVDKTPGLTRDRRDGVASIAGHDVTLIDTAGLEDAETGTVTERMRAQTVTAVEEADHVLFVIDARHGVTPADEVFAQLVRKSGKPVTLLANKCEGRSGDDGLLEAWNLGLGEPVGISAEHGVGLSGLADTLEDPLETYAASGSDGDDNHAVDPDEGDEERALKVAIVGRPNAGKSTLANALLGEERMITGPEAGITRDSIESSLRWGGRDIRLWDTAGLRKRARVQQTAEKLSVGDALRAVRFAEVVVLLLDAEIPLEKQDLTIAHMVAEEGRALVLAINKWDLIEDRQAYLQELRREAERLLPQVRGVPLVTLSATSGRGIDKLMNAVFDIADVWNRRISTGELNRFLEDAVATHTPPAPGGRRIRLRYMTQPNARPPTFVVFCSKPNDLPTSYVRYLINGLRDTFQLPGVPIRINLRKGKNPYSDKA
ncbi:MAG: ribosome biogenesis GTPase Der [Pseudomonadota bacterium]